MYILRCSNNTYYTGSTKDLERRIEEHQLGLGANYTRKHLPVKLVYFEEFERIDDAFYREKQVHNWSQKKKEALINNNIEKLIEYSKSHVSTSRQARRPNHSKTKSSTSSETGNSTSSETGNSTSSRSEYKFEKKVETKIMKTALIQQSNTSNIEANKAKLAKNIAHCAQHGAQLVVLQELHNSLYFCQVEDVNNFDLAESIPGLSTQFYGELAKKHKVVLVTSLFEKRATGLYHNTAVVFEKDGNIAGTYRKMHIPDDPGFYEKFYFTPGDLGFHPIQTSVGKLGVLVCWDQWYPEAARMMALAGAELLIYPTAIGWDMRDSFDEREHQKNAWITVQRGHAVANGIPVIAVNRVGHESDPSKQSEGINFWGSSFIAGPQGEFLHLAPTNEEENAIIKINMKRSEEVRRIWPFLRDRRIEEYGDLSKRFRD